MRAHLSAALAAIGRWFSTRRLRRNRALSASEAHFRSLFEEAPVAYHEIDREGIVQRVNQAECELLGYDRAEMAGHPKPSPPPQNRNSSKASGCSTPPCLWPGQ